MARPLTLLLLTSMTLPVVAPGAPQGAPLDAPPHFELSLRDQYGGRLEFPPSRGDAEVVTIVAYADREGSEANRRWAEVLVQHYRAHLEEVRTPTLRIVPVAHLDSVPSLIRGLVRLGFRGIDRSTGERILPIGLDWHGDVARQLGFVEGTPNLAIFDTKGALRTRVAASADEPDAASVLATLDELLSPSAEELAP